MNKEILNQYRNKLLNIDNEISYKRTVFSILKNEIKSHNLALVGLRQVGKTTLMLQLALFYFNQYINEKIASEEISQTINYEDKIFYLNLKFLTNLEDRIVKEDLFNEITNSKYKLVVLDEIQMISNWTDWLQAAIDLNSNARFVVSGSNARAIKNETMVNRMKTYFINPLLYIEYKEIWKNDEYNNYFQYGSFPKSKNYDSVAIQYRELIKYNILDKIVCEDLKNNVDGTKFLVLLKKINNYIGNEINFSDLEKDTKITRQTVSEYIKNMQATNLIHLVPKWNDKNSKRKCKVYYEDKSMIYYFSDFFKLNNNLLGSFVENLIHMYLLNKYQNTFQFDEIYYYKNNRNQEIDFVSSKYNFLIECKFVNDLDINELTNNLNNRIIEENEFINYKKIVITKDYSNNQAINGWYFYSLFDILEGKYEL